MLTDTLSFLTALKDNNTKEWFDVNRSWYQKSKSTFEAFINKLIHEMAAIDKEIGMLEAKDCTFRIFRDVRFSNDKTPYKSNMGGYIAKGGRKSKYAGYYFHMEPGMVMLAGGIWMPEPDVLKALRNEIYYCIDEFKAIISDKNFIKHYGSFDTDGGLLKTAPKDFPKDFPDVQYLKYKSYTVSKQIDSGLLSDEKTLLKECVDVFKALKPVNDFFNRAVNEMGN